MKKYFAASILFVILCSAAVLSTTGCHKKKDTLCNIYVLDTANARVAGARVELKGVPSSGNGVSTVDVTLYTDASGVAQFDFSDDYQLGQAGVFVLNIEASHGTLAGTGIVKVEEETTSEQTVFIQ